MSGRPEIPEAAVEAVLPYRLARNPEWASLEPEEIPPGDELILREQIEAEIERALPFLLDASGELLTALIEKDGEEGLGKVMTSRTGATCESLYKGGKADAYNAVSLELEKLRDSLGAGADRA